MKNRFFGKAALGITGFLFLMPVLWAQPEDLKGEDWARISKQRKIYYVTASMEDWNVRDVIFSYPLFEYIHFLDEYIDKHPQARKKDMAEIFRQVIYEKEPDMRRKLQS